jgi:hypothetical protein
MLRHFLATGRRCPDQLCTQWHLKCPGGCGNMYNLANDRANWLFTQAANLADCV